jgi:hypothetical protein
MRWGSFVERPETGEQEKGESSNESRVCNQFVLNCTRIADEVRTIGRGSANAERLRNACGRSEIELWICGG